MKVPLFRRIAHTRTVSSVVGSGHTHAGGRASNEDVLLVDAGLGLYAVFDGMGGHAAGEVAAHTARDALSQFTRKHAKSDRCPHRDLLEFGIKHAAVAVYEAGQQKPLWRRMGSTVVACLVIDSTAAVIGHVGDSRAYLLRDDVLQRLTRDHNAAQEALDGGMNAEEVERAQLKHILIRTLGTEHGAEAEMLELSLRPRDRILLCSDGLYDCVPQDQLELVLGSHAEPRHAARALIEVARASDTITDNVSAVVLDVRP